MDGPHILVVRLGALGDLIHTLPAVASLKHSNPFSHITWAVEARWAPLLEGNPYLDRVLSLDRATSSGWRKAWRELRAQHYEFGVDFQGLLKSAVVAAVARPDRIYGFQDPRETAASWFYSTRTLSRSVHVVDRNLDLAAAAGASSLLHSFPLPPGRPEGKLPPGEFVLASPLAGWGAKQWPMEHFSTLGERIERESGMSLVLNGPREISLPHTRPHVSGLPGLIDATRRAAAVVGVDSGPLHLAAALGKPGVAIFGPTCPSRNGPYQSNLKVLRAPGAVTSYLRGAQPDPSMLAITPDMVFEALVRARTCSSVTQIL
jgi:heptosyltransferase-1